MIDRTIKVALGSEGVPPLVKITQGDTQWRFAFQVFWNNQRYTIPSGSTAILSGRKPDGLAVELTGSISGNVVYVSCTSQFTAVSGLVPCTLQLFDSSGKLVNSCPVLFACAPDAKGGAEVSASDLSAYEELLANVQQLLADYNAAGAVPGYVSAWLAENITNPDSPPVDASLTVTGAAADAATVGAQLAEIAATKSNYLALTAVNSSTIPDNSDINDYKTAGTYKITNNTHAGTMTNMPVKMAGKLVVIALGQEARLGQLYFVSSGFMPIYVRFWNGSTWTEWQRIIRDGTTDALTARIDQIDDKVAPITKKVNVLYESGSYASGDATERISVYIPASVGYILYRLYHFIVPSTNCNCWQVYYYYATDESFSNPVQLSVSGELECAIHLDGRDDFSGGRTHGDEVLTGVSFFVNGVPADITTYTAMTEVDSFRIVRTTTMYDPADHTTAIASHGVEYLFDKNGMTISQSLEWLVAAQLTNCFLAMFLPSKNMIDRAVVNTDFETLTLASESSEPLTTITKQKSTKVFMWDTETPYSASVEVLKYPTGLTGGDRMSIGDNGGGTYNKVYFKVCGGGSSTVGELWQSKVLYKLNNGR